MKGGGFVLQGRKIVQIIVERFEGAVVGVAEEGFQPPLLGFAREKADAHRLRRFKVFGHFVQHGEAARDVKPADADGDAGVEKGAAQVNCTGELVGLDADHADQGLGAGIEDMFDQRRVIDGGIGFVQRDQFDGRIVSEHLSNLAVLGQPVDGGHGIRRDESLSPADRVAVVVVMGRTDHDKDKSGVGHVAFPDGWFGRIMP